MLLPLEDQKYNATGIERLHNVLTNHKSKIKPLKEIRKIKLTASYTMQSNTMMYSKYNIKRILT